jgi:pyrroline-5-carboxylate reductase
MKQLQIGVMGSAADLNYSKEAENFAKEIGACATDNQTVAKEADYIFLGVKP